MNRVFVTGDKHRNFDSVEYFCSRMDTDKSDLIIVLGDNGVNWYDDKRDDDFKKFLSDLPVKFMMIRGNHDMRPQNIHKHYSTGVYQDVALTNAAVNGKFLVQDEYPDLLFAKDGCSYNFSNNLSAFVIGGAHSIDKRLRLENGYPWFEDEQLNQSEMIAASRRYSDWLQNNKSCKKIMLTHTCPYRFIPRENLLPWPTPEDEDYTMERWFDSLYEIGKNKLSDWYCGHWHICKNDDIMRFMYDDFWMIV